jgi:lysozyme
MSTRARKALAAGSGLSVVALTATYLTVPWEAVKPVAYWDALGKVWTVCVGDTKGVKKGDKYTYDQCMNILYVRMENDYHKPLQKCIKGFDGAPRSVQAAMLDLSWNIGAGGTCNSSAADWMRKGISQQAKGDTDAAKSSYGQTCEKITLWNRAGGQVVRGLDLRRKDGDASRIGEREFCRTGLETLK